MPIDPFNSGTPLNIPAKKDVWGWDSPTINPNVKFPDNTQGFFNIDTGGEPVDLSKEEISISSKKLPNGQQILDATTASLFGIDAFLSKQNQTLQDQNYIRRERNIFQGKPVFNMDKNEQPIIMAEKGAKVRLSNNHPLNNVNAEGGEVLQLPDLTMEHIEGSKHSKGGVNITAPGGAKIFSNKLKADGKRTFADLAKKYDVQQYLDVLQDPFADRIEKHTAELMLPRTQQALDELFALQQSMNNNSEGEEMTHGGKAKKAYPTGGEATIAINNLRDYFRKEGSYDSSHKLWKVLENAQTADEVDQLIRDFYKKDGSYRPEHPIYDVIKNSRRLDKDAKLTYEEWKKTKSPVILDTELQKQYQDYLNMEDPIPTKEGPIEGKQKPEDVNEYIYNLFNTDKKLQGAFFEQYKKLRPDYKGTVEDALNNLRDYEGHLSQLHATLSPEDLIDPRLDRGKTNEHYNKLMSTHGFVPKTAEQTLDFQAAYRSMAKLKSNKDYTDALKDFDLDTRGLPDQIYGEMNYPDGAVSPDDSWSGNTTLGQMFKYTSNPINTLVNPAKPGTPYTPPAGNTYDHKVPKLQQTNSSMGKFPLYQAIPEVTGFASAMNTFPYWTPDYSHWEMNPQELNIQPQLQSIDDSFTSAIRENTGNPSVNFSRNTAMFNQTLQNKQQAFANKQNFDAESRLKTDSFNIDARNKEQQLDITAANHIYNDYFSVAKDNAGTERQSALSHLTKKMANYYQDEFAKVNYFDTVLDNYYYDGKDTKHAIKLDAKAQESIDISPTDLAYLKAQREEAKKNKTTK